MSLPLLGNNASLSVADRKRVRLVADAVLRAGKDQSGGDVHVFLIGVMNAVGYAIARAEPPIRQEFIDTLLASTTLWINAYKQDGPGGRFSKDS